MGQSFISNKKPDEMSDCQRVKTDQLEEYNTDPSNGLVLNGIFLPFEVIVHILSYVDTEHLQKKCILVCKQWRELIQDFVWKEKAERILNKRLMVFPWELYYTVCWKNNFDVNLIKNSHGENNFSDWKILTNDGDNWIVECPPQGADPLPDEFGNIHSCFTTSYGSCSKVQIIDLLNVGFLPKVLDELQPHIYVSEWCGLRFDCGCVYKQNILLLDEHKNTIKQFKYRYREDGFTGGYWHKIAHTFKNYGPNVRYVSFYHGGQDTQFWAGHYGSKMTKATVKVLFDSILKREGSTEDDKYKCIYVTRKGKEEPKVIKKMELDDSEGESFQYNREDIDLHDYQITDDSDSDD